MDTFSKDIITRTSSSSSSSSPLRISKTMKPERVRFMLYLRVLLKYLQRKEEQKRDDKCSTYETLKLALHECAAKSRRHEKGYESLTLAMQRIIPEIVSQEDLQTARDYTNLFVQRKRQMHRSRQVVAKQAFQSLDLNASHHH
mmetsp:Transcript_5558/g.11068  ORF Transcript_5558/g.11068 Transcript_5558/m.11068 type:complete len:143 (+) Transcript_5558:199-627(+)